MINFNDFRTIWIFITGADLIYSFFLLKDITFYFDPDFMDYSDQRSLLNFLLVQLFIFGIPFIWCQPLSIFIFIIPLLFFWYKYYTEKVVYMSRTEIILIYITLISYIITLSAFFITEQEPKSFNYFAETFLFFPPKVGIK